MSDRDIERIQEYLDTHPNAEGLPDGVEDAKQPHDFDWTQGNWESAEVAPPTSDLNRNNNFGENNTNPYWNELQLADDLAAGTSVGWDAHAGLGMSQSVTYQGNGEVEVAIARGLGAGASVSADHRVDLLSANDDDLSGKSYEGCGTLGVHLHGKVCGGYNVDNNKIYLTTYGGYGYGVGVTVSEVYRETGKVGNNNTNNNTPDINLPKYDYNIDGMVEGWR